MSRFESSFSGHETNFFRKMESKKLELMEEHFIKYYENSQKRFSYKLHKILNPNCFSCKNNDELYQKLKKKMNKKTKK